MSSPATTSAVVPTAPTGHASPGAHEGGQFALLTQRRFGPFFWVQFFGAGNDNVFKFAFTVLVTYQLQLEWLPASLAGLVIGALFILPFLLFSATSGQLADKYPKQLLTRRVKDLEIAIMLLAGWGFMVQQIPLLLGCVFLMGLHSTVFGPVKFAYLPHHLGERELTGGNGMVEMGTFVAILLGNVAGGLLIALPLVGPIYVGVACVALALLGRILAQAVPVSGAVLVTTPQEVSLLDVEKALAMFKRMSVPVLGLVETPDAVPDSITASILDHSAEKKGLAHAG